MPDSHDPLCVLVVDDEPVIADSLSLILQTQRYHAVAVYSAESAMALLPKLRPNAVISDVAMGEMSGIDLAIHIREEFPACHVLLMSGRGSTEGLIEQSARRGHFFTVLQKPVPPREMLDFLASCVLSSAD